LNRLVKDIEATVLAKVETFNPGNSIKDRMAIKMIEDAEKDGRLKPGGTIIEGTSGNTGMGLAIGAIIKGYKCIFTTTDKQSREKVDILRAFGAEVIVCPTNVDPEDPRSYYSVSSRLEREVPNSWKPNQYDNLSNSQAHYESTGPEIWEQTGGKVTHFVSAMGTTGTITGVSRYLKEKNPAIRIIGAQPSEGSRIPGIRKWPQEYLPKIYDPSHVDELVYVSQNDAEETCRQMARSEGIFAGISAAGACWVAQQVAKTAQNATIVFIVCDRGDRYLSTGVFPA
jgi:cysteine synthase B